MSNDKETEVIKNNERGSFVFYRSFYEALSSLPKKNQLNLYTAIMEYSFNLNLVQLDGFEKAMFELVKPQLDANNRRFLNGCKSKSKQETSKVEAKDKQNISKVEAKISKVEANVNVNDNVNVNVNDVDVVVQQAINDSDFMTFWNCCRKKSRKFMKDTYEYWLNMDIDKELLEQIVIGVKGYCCDPKIEYKFMKYPRTILEDEIWKEYCESIRKEEHGKGELQKETDRQLLYFHEMGTTREEFLEKGTSVEKLDELKIYE